MKLILSLFTAVCLFLPAVVLAQQHKLSVSASPSWAAPHPYDPSNMSLDKHAADGKIDLVYESATHVGTQVEYIHHTIKIVSAAGVQNGSEISVSFDPTFQRLVFHSCRIVRNNETIDKLHLPAFKVVQKEEDRNSFIYDGSLTAVNILDDVRPGDIIDYSYSLQGFNPIFKGKYASFYTTQFGVPVYKLYYKLIVPEGRNITFKNFNDTLQPVLTNEGKNKIFEWSASQLLPFKTQDKLPSWFDPYPQFMVSEFTSWKELNDWALTLFPRNQSLSPALAALIKKIDTENNTDTQKIQQALRFVQDDIRYMGFEMGEHSHKPASASQVCAQRFGDCKEKSYLLCTMLQAMHISADPVLINTVYKKTIKKWLPSSSNFDHAVVRVNINNKSYYFDPTISYQRGDITSLQFPDYQVGLVLTDSTTALTTIACRNTSSVVVKNEFTTGVIYGKGILKVTTINKGSYADDGRESFKSNSSDEMLTEYKKFYDNYFPDIIADSINFVDDDSSGIFTTMEYYTIPKFFKSDKELQKFTVSPFIILSIISRPADKQRNMPFGLATPVDYKESTFINLPENWTFKTGELHLKNDCFAYNFKMSGMFNKAFIEADYHTFKDFASPAEIEKYLSDIDALEDGSTYDFTYGDKVVKEENTDPKNQRLTLIVLLLGLIIVAGFVTWSQKKGRI